jgi:hypothetical protein
LRKKTSVKLSDGLPSSDTSAKSKSIAPQVTCIAGGGSGKRFCIGPTTAEKFSQSVEFDLALINLHHDHVAYMLHDQNAGQEARACAVGNQN